MSVIPQLVTSPLYLGSRSTFTLGNFGGHSGRPLRTGDVLRLYTRETPKNINTNNSTIPSASSTIPGALVAPFTSHWQVHVITGPQGSSEFFTTGYLISFYTAHWSVHFNSSGTGIRLTGPKPEWARTDGGEAGMHPSNLHDNAYAFGTIDFTGDMPVILGPDGPSLQEIAQLRNRKVKPQQYATSVIFLIFGNLQRI